MTSDDALWRDYAATRSAEARDALILRYVPLARHVVDRLNVPERGGITRDDLVSHALIGLMDAVERFDPARGIRFETFALPRVRGEVADMLRRMDWAPRSVRRQESEIRAAMARLEAALGRPATDEELADELKMEPDRLRDALADVSQSCIFSLDDALRESADGALTVASLLEDRGTPSPGESAEAAERADILAKAIGRLPERERLVVALYYYEDLTLKEIGAVLEVTEARVSQLHTRAVLRLNGMLQRARPVLCG